MNGAWEARSGSQAKFYLERYLEKKRKLSVRARMWLAAGFRAEQIGPFPSL